MANLYLIIDDCPDNLFILDRMIKLSDKDATVVQCSGGPEAMEAFHALLLEGKEVTHILSDFDMPDMNGKETLSNLCSILKQFTGVNLRDSGIIHAILTANATYKDTAGCDRMCKACVTDIYYKPLNRKELIEIIL
jgi:CheY-like chemotaxis protein